MADKAQINPGILSWARETAGLSVEKAAEKLGLKSTAKATAARHAKRRRSSSALAAHQAEADDAGAEQYHADWLRRIGRRHDDHAIADFE